MHYFQLTYRISRDYGIRELRKRAVRHWRRKSYSKMPFPKAIRLVSKHWDNEQLMDFAWAVSNGLIKPAQNMSEIAQLLQLLRDKKPSAVLEIGTEKGGTFFLWCNVATDNALLITVDILVPSPRKVLLESFSRDQQVIAVVAGDSHSNQTKILIEKLLDGKQVDFLFIDGDHSFEGVKSDFEMYAPLVRQGGLIAFHDIVFDHGRSKGIKTGSDSGEVPVFWQEIKRKFDHLEFIENPDQNGRGIGVIEWPGYPF